MGRKEKLASGIAVVRCVPPILTGESLQVFIAPSGGSRFFHLLASFGGFPIDVTHPPSTRCTVNAHALRNGRMAEELAQTVLFEAPAHLFERTASHLQATFGFVSKSYSVPAWTNAPTRASVPNVQIARPMTPLHLGIGNTSSTCPMSISPQSYIINTPPGLQRHKHPNVATRIGFAGIAKLAPARWKMEFPSCSSRFRWVHHQERWGSLAPSPLRAGPDSRAPSPLFPSPSLPFHCRPSVEWACASWTDRSGQFGVGSMR